MFLESLAEAVCRSLDVKLAMVGSRKTYLFVSMWMQLGEVGAYLLLNRTSLICQNAPNPHKLFQLPLEIKFLSLSSSSSTVWRILYFISPIHLSIPLIPSLPSPPFQTQTQTQTQTQIKSNKEIRKHRNSQNTSPKPPSKATDLSQHISAAPNTSSLPSPDPSDQRTSGYDARSQAEGLLMCSPSLPALPNLVYKISMAGP
jgi:hypothetical protein